MDGHGYDVRVLGPRGKFGQRAEDRQRPVGVGEAHDTCHADTSERELMSGQPGSFGQQGNLLRREDEQADFSIFSRVVLSEAKARPNAQRFSACKLSRERRDGSCAPSRSLSKSTDGAPS